MKQIFLHPKYGYVSVVNASHNHIYFRFHGQNFEVPSIQIDAKEFMKEAKYKGFFTDNGQFFGVQ